MSDLQPLTEDALAKLKEDPKFSVYNTDYWQLSPNAVLSSGQKFDSTRAVECIAWSSTLSKFTVFPKLPVELRLQIWKEALPDPQTVQLYARPVGDTEVDCGIQKDRDNHERYPTHMLACRESYEVFQENYTRIEVKSCYEPDNVMCRLPHLDLCRDTIVLGIADLQVIEAAGCLIDLSKVENLGLGEEERLENEEQSMLAIARKLCPRLKQFHLVLGELSCVQGYDLHLLEVDNGLKSAEITDNEFRFDVEEVFLQLITEAASKKEKLQLEIEKSKHTSFTISLLGIKIMGSIRTVTQWLVPVIKQRFDVVYYARRPRIPNDNAEIFLFGPEISIGCRGNGEIDTWYDGIRELLDGEEE